MTPHRPGVPAEMRFTWDGSRTASPPTAAASRATAGRIDRVGGARLCPAAAEPGAMAARPSFMFVDTHGRPARVALLVVAQIWANLAVGANTGL